MSKTAYPLSWPEGWKRAKTRVPKAERAVTGIGTHRTRSATMNIDMKVWLDANLLDLTIYVGSGTELATVPLLEYEAPEWDPSTRPVFPQLESLAQREAGALSQ